MTPGSQKSENPLATLVHISDLHFGETFQTQRAWYKPKYKELMPGRGPHNAGIAAQLARTLCGSAGNPHLKGILKERFERKIPAVVVHTGDLTCSGLEPEFVTGQTFLYDAHAWEPEPAGLGLKHFRSAPAEGEPLWSPRVFDIPGNHDLFSCAQEQDLFEKFYPDSFPIEYELPGTESRVVLYGMNSNQGGERAGPGNLLGGRLKGKVNSAQLDEVCRRLREGRKDGRIQVVCLHHPLEADADNNSRDDWVCLDNRDVVRSELLKTGAHLVLAGHIHRYARLGPGLQHVIAGTGTQRDSNPTNNFLVFDLYDSHITWTRYDWNKKTSRFEANPPISLSDQTLSIGG